MIIYGTVYFADVPALEGLFLEELSEELSEELEPIQPSRLIQEAFDCFIAA